MFTYIFTEKMLSDMSQSLLVEISMLKNIAIAFNFSFPSLFLPKEPHLETIHRLKVPMISSSQ